MAEIERARLGAGRSDEFLQVFAGKLGFTTITCGPLATLVIGIRSLAGSKAIFL